MSEFLSAICKWSESSLQNPGREPAFCRLEALESLNGFESSVQLFVVALNEIGRSWAAIVEELFCFDVASEEIGVLEDVFERCDLHRIIVMAWGSPANVTFEICLSQVRKIEDLLFQIFDESSVGFLAAHFQGSSNVLQKMDMTELHDDTGVNCSCRHANGFIVVTDESL